MKLFGLEPEQLGVVNPLLILLLIPIHEKCVYPFLRRIGKLLRHEIVEEHRALHLSVSEHNDVIIRLRLGVMHTNVMHDGD
jgi:hypothetical protein